MYREITIIKSIRTYGRVKKSLPFLKVCWLSSNSKKDTIFSLSTAPGKAGIAVIRVSGPHSYRTVEELASKKFAIVPRKLVVCTFLHPKSKDPIDKGMVVYFPGPHSFTGDDVVEYHIHGGKAVINGLLTALNNCSVERIRQAEPGEFAKRAFYNGKLDLTSLEGLSDLINSETEAQRKQAFRQMTGDLKNLYDNWRQRVIEALAYTNAVIDFGEEEMDVADTILPAKKITQTLLNDIKNHLYDDKRGVRLREGVHITIMGPPNSGKSSLMNWLTQRSTSIVSNIPGTTRDVIESFVDIGGYPVVFTDTAGLRSTVDLIEQEGIRRALEQARLSDLRIIVLDANNLISLNNVSKFKELFQREALPLKNTDFILLNKTDLIPKETSSLEKTFTGISKAYPHQKVLKISCKDKTNLQQFLNQLIDEIKTKCESSSLVPTQTRHRLHLEKCEFFLQKALEEKDLVLFSEELNCARQQLEYITGRISLEDVLDRIFSGFCIGK